MNDHPTRDQLRDLIRDCDDRAAHHVLWVAKSGDVHVSPVPPDKTPVGFEGDQPDMLLRCETFQAGNDYVGPDAAADDDWVGELYELLMAKWPKARGKGAVEYVDQF